MAKARVALANYGSGGLVHAPHYKRQPARRPRVVCSGFVKERSSETVREREREIDRDTVSFLPDR